MRFLAVVLTLQHPIPQDPLTPDSWYQLRHDVSTVFFPTELACQHLLTVTCLRSEQQETVLRLTLAEQQQAQSDALSQLLSRLHSGVSIPFCQRDGEMGTFDISDSVWTGISTWADFQRASSPPLFRFVFATPLITASPQTSTFSDALPFPEPETIFLRALEHWHILAGPPFPWSGAHLVQATRCVLANYCLDTVEISSPSHPIVAYRGWVEYSCLQPQAEEMAALAALARMTFFTGCGYETALGFGTTKAILGK